MKRSLPEQSEQQLFKVIHLSPSRPHYFELLHEDVLKIVLSFLDPESSLTACSVCREWNFLLSNELQWENNCRSSIKDEYDYLLLQYRLKYGSWKQVFLHKVLFSAHRLNRVVISRAFPGFQLDSFDRFSSFCDREIISSVLKELELDKRDADPRLNSFRDSPFLVTYVQNSLRSYPHRKNKFAIVKVPMKMKWKIHEEFGIEWVVERHRTWGKFATEPTLDPSYRQTKDIVIDISAGDGLQLTDSGSEELRYLARKPIHALSYIPRDDPRLVKLVIEKGAAIGPSLKIVSIPADVDWFIASQYGREYVSEAYHIWPADLRNYTKECISYGELVGNKITAAQLADRWLAVPEEPAAEIGSREAGLGLTTTCKESLAEQPDEFANLTALIQDSW